MVSPKIFQIGSKLGIRAQAVVPGAGRIDGRGYSMVLPVDVFWTGESWNRTVFREFRNRKSAQAHLEKNMARMIARAEKQFGTKRA